MIHTGGQRNCRKIILPHHHDVGNHLLVASETGVYKVEFTPPPVGVGGNEIKGFGDGGKIKSLKEREKKFF